MRYRIPNPRPATPVGADRRRHSEGRRGLRSRFRAAGTRRALGLTLAAFVAAGSAEAYRFFDARGDDTPLRSWRLVGADEALRWAAASWGPGTTLAWEVAPDPDFEGLFGDAAGVLPYMETALASWADLPSTDISWTAAVTEEADDEESLLDEEPLRDDRNTFFLDAESGAGGYAVLWSEQREDGVWELVECDFTLGSWAAQPPRDPADEARRLNFAVAVIVHELGHCIGLAHAGSISMRGRYEQPLLNTWFQPTEFIHPRDPAMSYGYAQRDPAGVPADDAIGASLLRPAPGWWPGTGSLFGQLRTGDEPAPWAQVWAVPTASDDPLGDRVGAFSDERGRFRLEGLPPGDYLLWTHPVVISAAHFLLGANGAPLDLDDTILGFPVEVRRGRYTTGVEVPMRIGRTSRPPPDAPPTEPAEIEPAEGWTTPCPGVRVRAGRPYPVDGPRGASVPVFMLGGDVWLTTTIELEWAANAGGVVFDWEGLYRDWRMPEWRRRSIRDAAPRAGAPYLDLAIPEWRMTEDAGTVRHEMVVDWPESAEAGLRFRSTTGECSDQARFVCRADGCGIR